jgi:hypothetical protein
LSRVKYWLFERRAAALEKLKGRLMVDWKTVREWAPTAGLVTALLMLIAFLKGIRRDRKAKRAEKIDDCIRNHFAGQPHGRKYPLEDILQDLATAPEVLKRKIKRPALNELKDSVSRLTRAGLLEQMESAGAAKDSRFVGEAPRLNSGAHHKTSLTSPRTAGSRRLNTADSSRDLPES